MAVRVGTVSRTGVIVLAITVTVGIGILIFHRRHCLVYGIIIIIIRRDDMRIFGLETIMVNCALKSQCVFKGRGSNRLFNNCQGAPSLGSTW